MCAYDSDEDGEAKPRCTLEPDCARQIVYCSCLYGFRAIITILGCIFLFAIFLFCLFVITVFGILVHVAVTVDDATLTRFSLVNTTALSYNLSLALTIRNPNLLISMKHVKPLEAVYSFDGQQFDRVLVAGEGDKQGPRRTVVYRLSTSSDMAYVALGNSGAAEFTKENATGVFAVDVVLNGRVSYTLRRKKCNLEASCPLKLQLVPPGMPPVMFEKVKCNLAKAGKYC